MSVIGWIDQTSYTGENGLMENISLYFMSSYDQNIFRYVVTLYINLGPAHSLQPCPIGILIQEHCKYVYHHRDFKFETDNCDKRHPNKTSFRVSKFNILKRKMVLFVKIMSKTEQSFVQILVSCPMLSKESQNPCFRAKQWVVRK